MQFLPIKFGIGFKMLYLCIVNKNDGIWTQGTKNLLSGLAKFSPCPERKKEVVNGDKARPKQKRKRNKKRLTKRFELRSKKAQPLTDKSEEWDCQKLAVSFCK